jgi:hypothetical protein
VKPQVFIFMRTAIVVLTLGLMFLGCLFICAHWHLGPEYILHSKEAVVGLATVAVIHGSVSHLAGDGGGIMGAAKALFTAAQPKPPAPPAAP